MKGTICMAMLTLSVGYCATTSAQVAAEEGAAISARLQYEIDRTKDLSVGYVPKDRLNTAYQQREALVQSFPENATPLNWIERGPYTDAVGPSNGNTRANSGVTAGRLRAVWVDLSDTTYKKVWVGGVNGGIWSTNDITVSPANWVKASDYMANMAIASICQDPTDHNIMYAGTGEKAINADAVRGAGIWRSTDHGLTWALMPGTANYWNVSKVVCDASGNLYVGCNSTSNAQGILRFTKATSTWTNITPTGLQGRVPDLELSTTGRLHISCGYYNTITSLSGYRYTDNPATVTAGTWSSPVTTFPTQYNVAFASVGNTVYALSSTSTWQVSTIYKSTDGGANWTSLTAPAFTSGQAWYCMAIAIDPNNVNNVVVGSLDCYKSVNGGSTWTKISNWVGLTGQYVHADQQIILWYPNNQILVGCDGGIHYSNDGGTTFRDRNVGLPLKQFYSVATHPTQINYFLAGAQDNGTHVLNAAGLAPSVEVTGGDGAFCHIDQDQPQYQFGAYVYNQYRRSTNGGSSWASVNYASNIGSFINPTDYDDTANLMYCGAGNNAYIRWDNPQTGSTFSTISVPALGGSVTAVKVSPFTTNRVYFGTSGTGKVVSIDNAHTAAPTATVLMSSSIANGSPSSIELGANENEIIMCFSNYGQNNLWVTYNGGTNWAAIDGNLPDMPVRWALFDPTNSDRAIIATETGVWQTDNINGAATVWVPEPGFPNVRVDMLQYRRTNHIVAAATHGRGIFSAIWTAVALPSSISALSLKRNEEGRVVLRWSTENETDLEKFVVEKSTDGRTFIALGSLAPKGFPTTYGFEDAQLEERNYYRLSIQSKNGSTDYSNVVSYWRSGFEKPMSAYPNPTAGAFTVSYLPLGEKKITLLNAQGKVLQSYSTTDVVHDVSLANFSQGSYLLVVKNAQGWSKNFTVQKK